MMHKLAGVLRAILPISLYRRIRRLADIPRYAYCLLSGRPYFGPHMLSAQTWATRSPYMTKTIEIELSRKRGERFNVLEIGSWAGHSTVIWAKALKTHGSEGMVFCIDPWSPYVRETNVGTNDDLLVMDRAAQRDRIFPLFWHNVKASGVTDVVVPIRGRSAGILPLLKERSFDLVFIDGSHAYSDFIRDLAQAGPLVKDQGLICGDDLELQADEVDAGFAEASREKDYVTDPRTRADFHPGVCLAVAHFFKRRISCYEGFWVQRKQGNGWENVVLS